GGGCPSGGGGPPAPPPPPAAAPPDPAPRAGGPRHDPEAFGELFRRHWHRIYSFSYRRSGSREVAEEVTAATFERAWRALPSFRWRGGGIEPWLFRIAASELAGWYRREGRHTTPRAQLALMDHADTRVVEGPSFEDDEAVRDALGRLRPRYQQALTLRFLAGLSPEEAAAAMGCSRPTLAVTVHRALAALRRVIAEEGVS
ncbi:MAG: RNA polymerase sigma factor, partial [Actinomycetota bacterium]